MPYKKRPDQLMRRNSTLMTLLPADGYQGPVPDWPISDPTLQELERWDQVWRFPQAYLWAEWPNLKFIVARWVRMSLKSEEHDAGLNLRESVRRLETEIGLTPTGLAKLNWLLDDGMTSTGEGVPQPRVPLAELIEQHSAPHDDRRAKLEKERSTHADDA